MANASDDSPIGDVELAGLFSGLAAANGIALCVSGGSDSTALLHLFARWSRTQSFAHPPIVLTVDHGLRPEAATEALHVERESGELGFRHFTLLWTGPKRSSDLQNAARMARYSLMIEAAKANQIDTLVTAHTLDDQGETFLLALQRGSGIYGLAAIPSSRFESGLRLVRPFLSVPKSRLIATLRASHISWSEDPSNANDRFRRVLIRKSAPELARLGLSNRELAATAGRIARAAAALDIYADRLIDDAATLFDGGFVAIDAARLTSEPEEVTLRALSRLLRAVRGAAYPPRLERLERLTSEIRACLAGTARINRTLGGVAIHASAIGLTGSDPTLWLFAEKGRSGFGTHDLQPGETVDWDGRVRITLSNDAPFPLHIRALGASARKLLGPFAPLAVPAAALATSASLWHKDELLAVVGTPMEDQVLVKNLLFAKALLGERLRSSRIGLSAEFDRTGANIVKGSGRADVSRTRG